MRTRVLAGLLAVTAVFAACGGDDDSTTTPTTPRVTTSTTQPATTTTSGATAFVHVYFLDGDAHLATGGREAHGADTPRAALDALLAGPTSLESDLHWSSAIPAGTKLLRLDVAGSTATVDLSGAFASGGGSASMLGRVAQVVYTLTQFPTIDHVKFALDGKVVESIGGEGVVVGGEGVDRSAFDAVLPRIFVESPTPGEQVTSPISVTGLNNTFENTVNYTVTDNDGLILKEGFTTGTGEIGKWGPFSASIAVTPSRPGLGEVIVYDVSSEDGSRQHLVEIPVQL
jgi:hypothetical protein